MFQLTRWQPIIFSIEPFYTVRFLDGNKMRIMHLCIFFDFVTALERRLNID